MASIVEVIIRAQDEASKVASGIANSIKGSFGGIGKAAGVAGLAIGGAALVGGAALGLMGKIAGDSTDAINSSLGAANNWASLTGDSFSQAKVVIKDLTKELATQASTLPGTTEAYTKLGSAVLDNVAGAFTEANGKVNKLSTTQWLKDSVANLEILRQAAGSTEGQTAKDISRFIGGQFKTERGLMQSDFFANNPTLMSNMKKAAKSFGFESIDAMLKSGDTKKLALVLRDASKLSVTDDLKKELGATFDGAVEGIKTKLFDPNTGALGGARDFNFNGRITNFNKQAAQALNQVGDSVGKVFATLGKVAEGLGFETDPLVILSQVLKSMTDAFTFGADLISGLNVGQMFQTLAPFVNGLQQIGNTIGGISMGKIDLGTGLTDIGGRIGKMLAGLINGAVSGINGLASGAININWVGIFSAISSGISSLVVSLVSGINWGSVAMVPINLGGVLANITVGIGAAIVTGLSASLAGVGFAIVGAFTALGPVLMFAVTPLTAIAGAAAGALSAACSGIGSTILSAIAAIASAGIGAVGVLIGYAGSIAGAIAGGMAAIGSSILSAVTGLMAQAQAAASSAIGAIGGMIGLGGGGIASSGGGIASSGGGRASGQGIGQFQAAVSRESRLMPAGAKPLIANSSELIVPRSDLGRIASSVSQPSRAGQANVNFSINLQIDGSGNSPQEIADEVLRVINRQYSRASRAAIA